MFGLGHGGNGMMNGNGARGYLPMTGSQKYPHNAQQSQHHHSTPGHQSQTHSTHPGHNAIGHQHTFSGGMLAVGHQGFGNNGPHQGSNVDEDSDALDQYPEHWRRQIELCHLARENANQPQWHSKQRSSAQYPARISNPGQPDSQDAENAERNRPNTAADDQKQEWDGMDLSGQALRAMNPALGTHYTFLTRLYLDNNKLTALPHSIRFLKNLKTMNVSNNQIHVLPRCIGMLSNLTELLLFDNQVVTLPDELGYLYKLEELGVVGNPLDEELLEFLKQNGTRELVRYVRDRAEVPPAPKPRERVVLDDQPAAETFTLLDHNILCDKYATRSQYQYTPTKALDWDYRRELILDELRTLEADIICLQEIDQESYNEFARRELAYMGYRGAFWPKTRARTMVEKEARTVDGCAIFYNGQKFILLDKQLVDFSSIVVNRPDMKGESDPYNRVMPKDNIGVVCFFENRMTGSRMIVATAHLTWDPAFKDVKLVQTATLMEQVSKLASKWATHPPCKDKSLPAADGQTTSQEAAQPAPSMEYASGPQIPIIVCGDFNSDKHSGVYELLNKGAVAGNHPDLEGRSYGPFTREGMSHPFKLASAYVSEPQDHIEFTNYTPTFSGLIDHVWHTPSLRPRQLLGNVDWDYIENVPGFPHFHFPSDHLALWVEFGVESRRRGGRNEVDVDHVFQHRSKA